jgi:predicted P-loop ATPase
MQKESGYDKSEKKSVFDRIHLELSKYYQIKFNELSLDFEIYDLETTEQLNFNESSLLIHLYREQITERYQHFVTYLNSHFITKYNPLIDYFENLPKWDGVDYISKYASYVSTDNDILFAKHLKKWAVRAVKTIFHSHQINKHCIILANGEQNAGKSTYLENLCPQSLKHYYYENIGISKDDRIKLCKAFIINIEEMEIMGNYDINSIKSTISQLSVNERLPYAKKSTLLYRTCSFLGSTNKLEFLNDDSGSVRWIVFEVNGRINFDYSQEFNIDNFWAHAFEIYKNNPDFKSCITDEEAKENEKRNERYTVPSVETECVIKYYDSVDELDYCRTATDVSIELARLGYKVNINKLGSAFKKQGFKRVKHPKLQIYVYLAKPKFKNI